MERVISTRTELYADMVKSNALITFQTAPPVTTRPMYRLALVLVVSLVLLFPAGISAQDKVSFEKDVVSLIAKRCVECHNARDIKGGLDLSSRETAFQGGDSGLVITAGDVDACSLISQIVSGEMPPESRGQSQKLPDAEIALLTRWIAEGAPWPDGRIIDIYETTTDVRGGLDWWSLQPVTRPEVPGLKHAVRAANSIDAFILSRLENESQETLDAYGVGKHPTDEFGRNCVIARRLVERGVRFIQLYSGGGHMADTWDAHESIENNHGQHAGEVDQPIAALLADLEQRGLLDSTLVVWGGEFGRMPFSEGQNAPGRNHNPYGFCMWMAGGGVKGGMSYGETDDFGFEATVHRAHVHDIHATILHLMGLDHERLTYFHQGREESLTDVHGRVINDICA